MKGYSRSREDFRERLLEKYFIPYQKKMEEKEIIGCLGTWESDSDFVLCEWDIDILPTLYEKDEIRYEYNQWDNDWSRVSCTIFSAIGALSDLINYGFSEWEIKVYDDYSYNNPEFTHIRMKWQGWYTKDAFDCVRKVYNASELSKKYWKIAQYRINKFNDELLEWVINKLYTIWWNHWLTSEYTKDKKDWMIDWTDFWNQTNWHAVDIINYKGQRSVKNSYKWTTNNIYWLKHYLSEISNFWRYFYVYTLVKEDNLERIKELNSFKSNALITIEKLWAMWHETKDKNFRNELHTMADRLRDKIKDINEQLILLS